MTGLGLIAQDGPATALGEVWIHGQLTQSRREQAYSNIEVGGQR